MLKQDNIIILLDFKLNILSVSVRYIQHTS